MEDNLDYSSSKLEQCSYRYLQQLAKSMRLPSNVKKVYLIEMINAKKCSSESEVERIVKRVKIERQHLTRQVKKRTRRTIIPVDSSSSESLSPPISITPKRPSYMVRSSDLRQQIVRSQNSLLRPCATKPVASDRVLRSCNVKTVKRPLMNKFLEVHQRNKIEHMDQSTQINSMHIVKKYKPDILLSSQVAKDRQLVPVTHIGSTQILVKRQRLLSGIYPIGKQLVQVSGVGVRDRQGKMATLNAFIHKPRGDKCEQTPCTNSSSRTAGGVLTLQDIINGNVEAHMPRLARTDNTGVTEMPEYAELTPESASSVYYHKKIRAEQVRERRMSAFNTRCELPRINEAFGQFRGLHERRDVSQPLYVHVGDEAERILHPQPAVRNTCLLETLYNFKSHFLTSQPLLQLATTAATKCVYSAPTVATAVPHRPATAMPCAEPYMPSYERDSQYYCGDTDSSQVNDCLRFADEEYDFRCHEEQNTSRSSTGTAQSQELGANVTISDMVEDALELISQDGDYMERMGMDVEMQCVLCNWAGPKIILEYHIRKEHSSEIDRQEKREWNITYTLGSVVSQQLWHSRVVEHSCSLYVLSVKYEPPGCFMATLSSLSSDPELTTASITMFNKVTGEPFSWCGQIQELPPSLPYETQPGLRLDLATLDLLPNSANLKFVNGELVLQSPTKVVFGPLELNDIHIILFVKISD